MRDFWGCRPLPREKVQIENINDTPDVIRQRAKDQAIFFSFRAHIYDAVRGE